MKFIQNIHPILLLLVATTFEVSGDAIIRICIYNNTGIARISLAIIGAVLLFGYGLLLNLAPVEFGKVVGIYIATLFIVWQIINSIAFRTFPSWSTIIGGVLIISGGIIITFWEPK